MFLQNLQVEKEVVIHFLPLSLLEIIIKLLLLVLLVVIKNVVVHQSDQLEADKEVHHQSPLQVKEVDHQNETIVMNPMGTVK